jgi:outer membrane protein OmpA-like peptidoglycan-associated protein
MKWVLVVLGLGLAACASKPAPTPKFVYYDSAKDQPHDEGEYLTVGAALETLARDPTLNLLVVGHADAEGDPERNRDLSFRRARGIRSSLLAKGIAPTRVMVAARGASQPVATNESEAGRAKNRRVELFFWFPKQGDVQHQYGVTVDLRVE